MKNFNLSDKETALLTEWAIIANDACGCWGSELLEDDYSWASMSDLTEGLFNKHEVSGLLSSLMEKGIALVDDDECRGKKNRVLYYIAYNALEDGVFKFLDNEEGDVTVN